MAENQEHHLRLFTRNRSRILWDAQRVSQTDCSRSVFRLQNSPYHRVSPPRERTTEKVWNEKNRLFCSLERISVIIEHVEKIDKERNHNNKLKPKKKMNTFFEITAEKVKVGN